MKALTKVGLAAALVTTLCATNISFAAVGVNSLNLGKISMQISGKHINARDIAGKISANNLSGKSMDCEVTKITCEFPIPWCKVEIECKGNNATQHSQLFGREQQRWMK